MVHPLSHDLRKRIVKAVDQGLSRNQAAAKFDVAVSTAVKLMQHVKATGGVAPGKIGGYRKHKLEPHDAVVRELVSATPDATLDELVARLAERGIATSRSGLDRYFARIGWSFKKNAARKRAGQARRQSGAGSLAGETTGS
jgi:putative transposase